MNDDEYKMRFPYDLDGFLCDVSLRTPSNRKIRDKPFNTYLNFVSYLKDDDMYGIVALNNGLPNWFYDITLTFEI